MIIRIWSDQLSIYYLKDWTVVIFCITRCPKVKSNPFEYTMSTLKSAFYSIFDKIKSNTLFDLKPQKQEKAKQIRYTKRIDFDEAIVKEYFKKRIDLGSKKFNNSLLIEPYYLEKL